MEGKRPAAGPPLRGFTPLHHALYDLIDVTVQVNSAEPSKAPAMPRPVTARDRLKSRGSARTIAEITAKAMGQALPEYDDFHREIPRG